MTHTTLTDGKIPWDLEYRYHVKPAMFAQLQADWPEFTLAPTGTGDHKHAAGAMERQICELYLGRYCRNHRKGPSSIVDIGGNAARHKAFKRDYVHSCNPILTALDYDRTRKRDRMDGIRTCQHLVQQCDCIPEFAAYWSVHSLYYISPLDILQLVQKAPLYAVIHRLTTGWKNEYYDGEAVCNEVGGEVEFKVKGNLHPYVHPACEWLTLGQFTDGTYGMLWNVVKETTNCMIIVIDKVPAALVRMRSLVDRGATGVLKGEELKHLSKVVKLDFAYFSKDALSLVGGAKVYRIPLELIDYALTYYIETDRTEANNHILASQLRHMAKNKKLAENEMHIVLPILIDIAMFWLLDFELALFDYRNTRINDLNDYNDARHLRSLTLFGMFKRWLRRYCCGTEGVLTCCLPKVQKPYTLESSRVPVAPAVVTNVVTYEGSMAYGPAVEFKSERGEIRLPHVHRERHDSGLRRDGIVSPTSMPVAHVQDTNTINDAVIRRFLDVPNADVDTTIYESVFRTIMPAITQPFEFAKWYPLWNSRFPANKRKMHDKALITLEERGLTPRDLKVSIFAKIQELINLAPGKQAGGELVKPRVIGSYSSASNVLMGPRMFYLTSMSKPFFDPSMPVVFASGYSGDELGVWATLVEETFDKPEYVECDDSSRDAHVGAGIQHVHRRYFDDAGLLGDECDQIMESYQNVIGRGIDGSWLKLVDSFISGRTDTAKSNTSLSAAKVVATQAILLAIERGDCKEPREVTLGIITPLVKYVLTGESFRTIVGGDDQLWAYDKTRHSLQLSLIPEISMLVAGQVTNVVNVSTKISQVTFYSAVFWPIKDRLLPLGEKESNYLSRYALGPKPGRVLSRIGWTFSAGEQYEDKLHAAYLSFPHVPFLYQFVDRVRDKKRTHRLSRDVHLVGQSLGLTFADVDQERMATAIYDRYGLTTDAMASFHEYCGTLTRDHVAFDHKVLECLTSVDI